MKPLKSLILISAIVAGLASSAFANTVQIVYVVGAPAYRQDSNGNIIANFVTGHAGAGITATTGPSASSPDVLSASANQWYIPNYFAAGQDLEISASYTGSTAGIEAVAAGRSGTGSPYQVKFIPDNTGSVATPVFAPTAAATQYNYPDVSLSDTFQSTTPFVGTVTEKGPTNTTSFTASYTDLSGSSTQLGIEPYVFVASPGANAAGLTNITTSQAQLLYKNGALPLAYFTGKATDEGTLVYGLTRDGGSGARLGLVTEVGLGTKTLLRTYKPTVGGGATDGSGNSVGGTISGAINLYPAGLIPSTGVWDNSAGDTGYSSFGTLLSAITATPPAGAIFVAYFNLSDGSEAINNTLGKNADVLSFNGTPAFTGSAPYTVAQFNQAAVQEGKYTFWAYEWLFPSPSAGTAAQSVINTLTTAGKWTASTPTSSVNVFRTSDGGPVLQNY